MDIPGHYRAFYRRYLRFAIVMLLVGLTAGILFQESTRHAPISAALPAGAHLEAILDLALVHGHAFLVGAVLPLVLVWMLHLGLTLGFEPLSEKRLKLAAALHLPGSAAAVALMLYKGYHYVIGVRLGITDFHALDEAFFGHLRPLRAAVYGLSHTAMALGIGILAVSFWRSMKPRA